MLEISVNLGMTISVILFALGYAKRKSNIETHRKLMLGGIAANLISAVTLVAGIYLFNNGDFEAAGFIPRASDDIILAHRLLAVVAVGLMVAMLWSGVRGQREMHIKLHRFFIPTYLVIYFSGLYIFSGT